LLEGTNERVASDQNAIDVVASYKLRMIQEAHKAPETSVVCNV
jgi:hypothetical protein